ncbi:MAG: histidine--tRNA ligase [Firmicutes bacterium]|nr:histidine--tRNA ligase [Bacillota bacterium]MCL5040307.1 histidine--tRNA ligase [Bacillota bacterium]
MLTNLPRGTNDILPGETERWQWVEEQFRVACRLYGYREIRTPVFEHTELFQRTVGESTDIVQKEMYTFTDRGGKSLTLRPEGTAGAARAYLEHSFYAEPQPVKLFYLGPMFRFERPQSGRYRQFHQYGVEVFGAADPAVDAEVIALARHFFQRLGLQGLQVHLNSIGCPTCRAEYRQLLAGYYQPLLPQLCEDCRGRFDRNVLRLLDCKVDVEYARTAPKLTDHLCADCQKHLETLGGYLRELGIAYELNPQLVRGLDYYTRTVFEIIDPTLGTQGTLIGGGRYDGLVEELGGKPTPGIGFAGGLERLLLILEKDPQRLPPATRLDVFLALLGSKFVPEGLRLLGRLRQAGLSADMDFLGRSLKGQLRYASKNQARFVALLGEEELSRGVVALKDMEQGGQVEVSIERLEKTLLERSNHR